MRERMINVTVTDPAAEAREARRAARRKADRRRAYISRGILVALLFVLAIIVAARAMCGQDVAARETDTTPVPSATKQAATVPEVDMTAAAAPVDAKDTVDAIVEMLLAQGYLSDAVPLSYQYQDYMRYYSLAYGCPYPLALAVADWETRGTFDMDAVGAAGEVGIFQLNPGPDGAYHAELEEATGLDPNTPMGNIAGGCYLLGKYMDTYNGDVAKVAMAYNMGVRGATKAWDRGITSTDYSDAIMDAVEKWEATVNAWRGF